MSDIFDLEPKGFIKNLVDDMKADVQGLNKDWGIANAEALLSSCCFKVNGYTQIGRLILPLWNLGIAVSGEFKSVPINYFIVPILEELQQKVGRHKRLRISRFSPESLIKFMTYHEVEDYDPEKEGFQKYYTIGNEGILIRDEFTSMITGIKDKKWLVESSELLSEVYDGSVGVRYTIGHGEQCVPYCKMAFLSATTKYIYRILTDDWFIQGLGNRADYIPFDPPEKAIRKNPEEFFTTANITARNEKIEKYAEQLYKLMDPEMKLRYVGVAGYEETGKMWSDFDLEIQELKRKLPSEDDLRYAYLSRQSEKALRRACIYCISRNIDSIIKFNPTELAVKEEDMRIAIARQRQYYQFFERFLEDWPIYRRQLGEAQTDKADKDLIIMHLKKLRHEGESNGWVSLHLLAHLSGYNEENQRFRKALDSLTNEGTIEELTGGLEKAGMGTKSRELIAKMSVQEMTRQRVRKPRGIAPYFYRYIEE